MSDNTSATVAHTAEAAPQEAPVVAAAAAPADASERPAQPELLRLGFARGIAPSTWARRWEQISTIPLELVPVNVAYGRRDRVECDVMLERVLPGERPAGSADPDRSHHAIQLYAETFTLVVAKDSDLAERDSVSLAELDAVPLLDHPAHPAAWPAAQPWEDPSWMPDTLAATLELVATGAGAVLLPTLLARHLSTKKEHALLPVTGVDDLPATTVWASWSVARDAADVQQLVGVLRGRTSRSSRDEALAEAERAKADARRAPKKRQVQKKTPSSKSGPKPGSRGAQLAATKKKPPHRGRR